MEIIGDKIIEILKASLPTALDKQEAYFTAADMARFGFVLTLDDIPAANYIFGDFALLGEYPSIAVIGTGIDFENKKNYPRHAAHQEALSFEIQNFIIDDDREETERKSKRYARAIIEVLQKNPKLSETAKLGTVGDVKFNVGKTKNAFFRMAAISVVYTGISDAPPWEV